MVSARTIQEIPLNGRHFVDLGPLVPGSVAPSQTGFSTTPIRGTGALAFNTAGNREEAVGLRRQRRDHEQPDVRFDWLSAADREHPGIQGRQLDVQRRIRPRVGRGRQPGHPIGQRPVSRRARTSFSGTMRSMRGTSSSSRRRTRTPSSGTSSADRSAGRSFADARFFFATYEGLRQRQGLDLNSLVLSDEAARSRDRPRRSPVDRADSPRELFRRGRHAAIRRLGRRQRR